MVDQEIKNIGKNIALPEFYTEESLLRDEYDIYQKTVDNFSFEQLSDVPNISKEFEIEDGIVDIETLENKKQDMVQLKEIKRQHPLSIKVMVESANNLEISGVEDENSFIHIDYVEKVVSESYKINAKKARANNPMCKKMLDETDKLVEKCPFETLIEQGYIVVIDTCSWMHANMQEITNNTIIPILEKYKKKVYITDPINDEIKKKLKSKDTYTYHQAESARKIMAQLGEKDLYRVIDNDYKSKSFADAHLITLFSDLRRDYKMALITNDNKYSNQGGLAGSIARLSDDPNINGIHPIKVLSIHTYEGESKMVEFSINKDSNFNLHAHAPLRVKL